MRREQRKVGNVEMRETETSYTHSRLTAGNTAAVRSVLRLLPDDLQLHGDYTEPDNIGRLKHGRALALGLTDTRQNWAVVAVWSCRRNLQRF